MTIESAIETNAIVLTRAVEARDAAIKEGRRLQEITANMRSEIAQKDAKIAELEAKLAERMAGSTEPEDAA